MLRKYVNKFLSDEALLSAARALDRGELDWEHDQRNRYHVPGNPELAQPWADAPFLIIVSINPAQRDTISGFPGTGYGPFPRALRNGKDGLQTDAYLLVWPQAATTDLGAIAAEDFTLCGCMLIYKQVLRRLAGSAYPLSF